MLTAYLHGSTYLHNINDSIIRTVLDPIQARGLDLESGGAKAMSAGPRHEAQHLCFGAEPWGCAVFMGSSNQHGSRERLPCTPGIRPKEHGSCTL